MTEREREKEREGVYFVFSCMRQNLIFKINISVTTCYKVINYIYIQDKNDYKAITQNYPMLDTYTKILL